MPYSPNSVLKDIDQLVATIKNSNSINSNEKSDKNQHQNENSHLDIKLAEQTINY